MTRHEEPQLRHVSRRNVLASLAALAVLPGPMALAQSSPYPNKPVKIIVPSTPGGLMDVSARLIGAKLSNYWNVPVIIDNKPGAAMTIGTALAAKSAPDGYTLLLAHEGAVSINPLMTAETPYSSKDFTPLGQVWDTALVLVVNADVPAANLKELDAHMRKNPGKLNYALNDTIGELVSDMLKYAMKWDYANITYKGNPERIRSIMAGETQLTIMSAGDATTAIDSGRVKALGVTSRTRLARLPNVPTMEEAGIPGFVLMTWGGFFAPSATPAPVLAKLAADTRRALSEPDLIEKIEAAGSLAVRATPDEFKQRIASDAARWRQLAERRGLKTYDR